MDASAQEQEILGADVLFCQMFTLLVMRQQVLKLAGDQSELVHRLRGLLFIHAVAHLRQI
jgi:hypothetical protein